MTALLQHLELAMQRAQCVFSYSVNVAGHLVLQSLVVAPWQSLTRTPPGGGEQPLPLASGS
jgi:hypothetical protein